MIEAIAVKLLFAPISLYELYISDAPRPFCMLELSIIAWGVCFIIGWWFTCQRVEKLYTAEGIVADVDITQGEQNKANCYRDKTKMQSIAWMLEVDNIGKFFFKALYWFSYAFIHSLFVFLVLAAIVYTFMIFNHQDADREWCRQKEFKNPLTWDNNNAEQPISKTVNMNLQIPALFGMKGLFVFFDVRFILMHVAVFIVSFITFYLCCVIFLKEENNPEDKKTIVVNRQRFKYLLYISYIFVDTCYMLFEFIMMLHIETPQDLDKDMDDYKKKRILEKFTELKDTVFNDTSNINFEKYNDFKKWILSKTNINTDSKVKLIRMIQQLPGRDAFCEEIKDRLKSPKPSHA